MMGRSTSSACRIAGLALLGCALLWADPAPAADSGSLDVLVAKVASPPAAKVDADDMETPGVGGGAAETGQVWRELAELLEKEALPYAALLAWSRAIAADPQGSARSVGRALDLAETLGDEGLLGRVLGPVVATEGALDPQTRSRAAVVAARHQVRRDNLGPALDLLRQVDRKSTAFPDAEALRGIVIANQGRPGDALAPLITAEAAARQADRAPDFQTAMRLNVARAYYAAGDWSQAVAWFAQVERSSPYWPDAQFQRAWAHFRADDMQNTLALLKNHESPFFDGWFYPEADLLRAYALFSLCKFPSVTAEIDAFVERYVPMKEQLDRALGSLDAPGAFEEARAVREGRAGQLPPAVIRSFRTDRRFGEALAAQEAIGAEAARLAQRGDARWAKEVAGWLEALRQERVQDEGQRVLDRARRADTELAEMLQGIEITRVDILGMETEMYERAAATGKLEYGDTVGKLRKVRKGKKGHRVWPFQGEYWADELGWFVVDARSDCPPSLSDGG